MSSFDKFMAWWCCGGCALSFFISLAFPDASRMLAPMGWAAAFVSAVHCTLLIADSRKECSHDLR